MHSVQRCSWGLRGRAAPLWRRCTLFCCSPSACLGSLAGGSRGCERSRMHGCTRTATTACLASLKCLQDCVAGPGAQTDAVRRQLDAGNIVLLSNLGYSAAGEVLNCDTYTVATRAAVDLQVGVAGCGSGAECGPNWRSGGWGAVGVAQNVGQSDRLLVGMCSWYIFVAVVVRARGCGWEPAARNKGVPGAQTAGRQGSGSAPSVHAAGGPPSPEALPAAARRPHRAASHSTPPPPLSPSLLPPHVHTSRRPTSSSC